MTYWVEVRCDARLTADCETMRGHSPTGSAIWSMDAVRAAGRTAGRLKWSRDMTTGAWICPLCRLSGGT